MIQLLIYKTCKVNSERLEQDDETNIKISQGEGGLEDLHFSLVPSSVELFSSLDLIFEYVASISISSRQLELYLHTKLRGWYVEIAKELDNCVVG